MTANNAIHQSRHQWVTSMSTALCGQVIASVGLLHVLVGVLLSAWLPMFSIKDCCNFTL